MKLWKKARGSGNAEISRYRSVIRAVEERVLEGREIAEAGRYLIARMLLDQDVAGVEPLSPANPLIFTVGPFAGTPRSNPPRTNRPNV